MNFEFKIQLFHRKNFIIFAISSTDWKNEDVSGLIKLLSVSYMWYSMMWCYLAVFFGLIFSLIISKVGENKRKKLFDSRCISPPVLKLYLKMCPNYVKKFVDLTTMEKVG